MGLIAIGDIHGCDKTLAILLERLNLQADDHIVFVGDYIDRGANSKGVIDRLLALREDVPCTFLRGNHEAMMLDFLEQDAYDMWSVNGGIATLSSYLNEEKRIIIPEEHLTFLRNTLLYYDTPEFFFVHAGLNPDKTITENLANKNEDVFLWERSHLGEPFLAWEKPVVCGHTPQAEPLDTPLLINIDTGCVYNMHPRLGRLCAVRLPEREYVLVDYVG